MFSASMRRMMAALALGGAALALPVAAVGRRGGQVHRPFVDQIPGRHQGR